MKLWSYPNPYKDDRKELCDLLVVFENHILIFFDRENRRLEKLADEPLVQWNRWRRDVIDDQINTANGAERYLRSGRGIFLDNTATEHFPIPINRDDMIVHKIVVAHGAEDACKAWSSENIYGSLAITYSQQPHDSGFPFMVDLDAKNPVHVFDSFNLPILLTELDTVFDLTSYLDEKVRAINSLQALSYAGEEDLLAHYFLNFDKTTNKHFIGVRDPSINMLFVAEGDWSHFIKSNPYKRKKEADKVSYFLDSLIQRTCQNAFDGKLGGDGGIWTGKSGVYELAKEPRFFRRELASRMLKAVDSFPSTSEPIIRNLSFILRR